MRNSHIVNGAGVAVVTPFKNGQVDYTALTNIIEKQIEGGIDFLVALGTTGEAATLSFQESQQILQHFVKVVNGRKNIVAGNFGGNNTTAIIQQLKDYNLNGIAAVMLSSPSYSKPSQEGIFQHYLTIMEQSPLPIIIYNVPGRTASNVSVETTLRLANASDKFIAIKDATGDLSQGAKLLKNKPNDFLVLSGDDPTAVPLMSMGAEGCISVIANVFPQSYTEMIHAAQNQDFKAATKLHFMLFDMHHWFYVENNPAGIKAALKMRNWCSDEVRLPLVQLSAAYQKAMQEEMTKILKSNAN